MQGKIVKSNAGFYDIHILLTDEIIVSNSRGILKHKSIEPVVGDQVVLTKQNDAYIIEEVLGRNNELIRPKIANIDIAIVVISVKEPELQSYLLDKYLSVIEFNDIKPIIIFTKMDLLAGNEVVRVLQTQAYYQNIGYEVFLVENQIMLDVEKFHQLLSLKTACVLGQTGVGKSTLLNSISAENGQRETNQISKALGRGKHTTRIVELSQIKDYWIADTPGFSSFSVVDINQFGLSDTFIEFSEFQCKFNNCVHINEQTCGVKVAVENGQISRQRFENYQKLFTEISKGGKKVW
ncbi:MAG: ribosome small subunit-dependent GTPase A [Culicoidibacterales bacterium]